VIPRVKPRMFRILYPKCLSICLKAVLIRFFNIGKFILSVYKTIKLYFNISP